MTTMQRLSCHIILSVLALSLSGCYTKSKSTDWISATEESHSESVIINGQLQSATLTPINSPVDGSISKIIEPINQHVLKHELLLEIDSPEALDLLRKDLNELRKNQRLLAKKEKSFENAKQLYEKYSGISKNEVDDLHDEVSALYDTLRGNYETVYKSAVLFGLNTQDITNINPSELYAKPYPVLIRAPEAGELVEQTKNTTSYSVGQTLKKHDLIALITNPDSYVLSNSVSEDDARLLKVGMSTSITSKNFKTPLEGKITSIKPQQSSQQSSYAPESYLVSVSIVPPEDIKLSIGMTVRGTVKIEHPKSLSIPISSVCIEGSDTFVRTPESTKHPVVLGQTVGQNIFVQQGLKVGDQLAQHCHD